jgi:broad specificity phosphatase PhoE
MVPRMSQLILIRHGQAAAFSADSDRLTELGRRQAEAVGRYLVEHEVRVDEVVTGGLNRQIETEQIAGNAVKRAGLPWPDARRIAGFSEYDAGAILGTLAPLLVERDPAFDKLSDDFRDNAQAKDRNRYFQRMLEALMDHWIKGTLRAPGVESFEEFHGRVRAAHDAIVTAPGSRTVLVFTSGGPIGACVQCALKAPPEVALALNWRVKNGSFTEFTFSSSGRLSLDSFNATPHLTPALQSFR